MMHPDTKLFLDMLLHDDRDSNYFVCQLSNGKMQSTRRRISEFEEHDFTAADCYLSMNGFIFRRRVTNCRQINAIYFDLDCHSEDDKFMREWKIQHTELLLMQAFESSQLPYANLVVHTGRGLALFFILENSISLRLSNGKRNEKSLFVYKKIREALEVKISAVLAESPYSLTLDKSVSDLSRIVRVPGTLNSKSNTLCRILMHNEDYYSFDDFQLPKTTPKPSAKAKANKIAEPTPIRTFGLQYIRLQELSKLQHYRKGEGQRCREFMLFLYYNAAVQIFEHDIAVAKLHDFNQHFIEPLQDTELESIILCTDKNDNRGHKGYYKISKDWIIEKLHITEKEITELGLFAVSGTSRLALALQKREAKAQRNKKILELASAGVKHQKIADQLGITKATVQNVLRANGAVRSYRKK